jgi:phosphomannomutase
LQPVHCGFIPSPAVAAWGLSCGAPTLMVTGSHIPDDRNGIKFNKASGEILKRDEAGIRAQRVAIPTERFDAAGMFTAGYGCALPTIDGTAAAAYRQRYLDFFPADCLKDVRIGLYEHSSVAREVLYEVLTELGAEVTQLGRTRHFVPVDTEAVRPEDVRLAQQWAAAGDYDSLVSTDGDGDRPLIADAQGTWLRGDIVGILAAQYLNAHGVVTPISSNTALERSGQFVRILRTRIGSPFVIEGMEQLQADGIAPVVGYEANGGFLLGTALVRDGRTLTALPTRDAMIAILAVLLLARQRQCSIAHLTQDLPQRFTASDRLHDFPTAVSQARIAALAADLHGVEGEFGREFGPIAHINTLDGLRITFASGEIMHLRPSGNAPELRVYTEADSTTRAVTMVQGCLHSLARWR